MKKEDSFPYEDIVLMEHPVSQRHGHMSRIDRAAQFSPFAALTGFGALVEETGRVTDFHPGIDPDEMERIDRKLRFLKDNLPVKKPVSILMFVQDETKFGGSFKNVSGIVRRIDQLSEKVILDDGAEIGFYDIFSLDGEVFESMMEEF